MAVSSYVTSPIPNPGVYGEYSALALKAWNEAKGAIRSRQAQIGQQYGFKMGFDENTGAAKDVGVDVNNPYGQYQMMLGRQGQQLDAAEDESHQRGLGGIGLGAQGLSRARWAHGAENVNFGRDFASQQGSLASDWQRSGFAYQQALLEAQRAAIQDAIANRQFNEAPAEMPSEDPTGMAPPAPTVAPGGNPAVRKLAAHQQLIRKLTPGSSVNEATRMAAQMPKPKAPTVKYYTTRAQVDKAKRPGQTVKFTTGRGYYLA